ncbi:MAG: DUF4136 domain-containing protein [Gammaproteobacteria bacterium]|nr:MAG: DUF4136 domain-containing protein [Gammaproteobacteria bacterium]
MMSKRSSGGLRSALELADLAEIWEGSRGRLRTETVSGRYKEMLMRVANRWLVVIGCLVLAGCEMALKPTIDYDPSVDFARYQTFSWIDPNPLISAATQGTLSPPIQQHLMAQIQQELTHRGLRFVEDPSRADLVVAFTIGSREGIRVYWTTRTVFTAQYQEGQLAIDILDVAQARPVWHGTVSRRITEAEQMEPGDAIREAVAAILEHFPPG